jgi:hypothetical protein
LNPLDGKKMPRTQITTGGHRAYAEAVEGALGMEVDYAMLIKLYGSPSETIPLSRRRLRALYD